MEQAQNYCFLILCVSVCCLKEFLENLPISKERSQVIWKYQVKKRQSRQEYTIDDRTKTRRVENTSWGPLTVGGRSGRVTGQVDNIPIIYHIKMNVIFRTELEKSFS